VLSRRSGTRHWRRRVGGLPVVAEWAVEGAALPGNLLWPQKPFVAVRGRADPLIVTTSAVIRVGGAVPGEIVVGIANAVIVVARNMVQPFGHR